MKMKYTTNKILDFLYESNKIEGIYDARSLLQAKYAWDYLVTIKRLTIEDILKTHKILMLYQNSLNPDQKGYFRREPVYIGGKEGIDSTKIEPAISEWLNNMNKNHTGRNIAVTKMFHVQYEKIHPFIDGNGRTGRMFMNWWRMKKGLDLLTIHEGEEQMQYYKWFI